MGRSIALPLAFAVSLLLARPAEAQDLQIAEHVLPNGMRVLVVPRHESPRVFCAVGFRVGSVNERPGITGISHLLEHMLFKGTDRIGITDAAADAAYVARIDEVWHEMLAIQEEERDLARHGEALLADRAERREHLRVLYEALLACERDYIIKDELWDTYVRAGGTFLNAMTSNDSTSYFVELPSNRVELFCWLESDRMLHPVFREFYSERDVVMEERRMSTDSTPTGLVDEAFEAMVWQAHPYGVPVVGWMSDLRSLTREDAETQWRTYYGPGNAVAVFVGDVDPDVIFALAERYFGRLPARSAPPAVRTEEPVQTAERRLVATVDSDDEVRIVVHGVPAGHPDSYALDVLAGVLSGRTGRLHRRLVEPEGEGARRLALEVSAYQDNMLYAGTAGLTAQPAPGVRHADVEAALIAEVERFANEPPTDAELERVKNQAQAGLIRSLQSNTGTAFTVGRMALYGTPDPAEELRRTRAVTAADVVRVAAAYFAPERRNVLWVRRRGSEAAGETATGPGEGPPPATGEGPPPDAAFEAQVRQGMAMLRLQWPRLRSTEMGPRILDQIRSNLDRVRSPDLRAEVEALLHELEADLRNSPQGGGQ